MTSVSDLAQLTPSGLVVAPYSDFLSYYQDAYRQIFGADVYLDADSQDGQMLAILALADYDTAQLLQSTYHSFSPLTALSDALSRNVKLNGITRRAATYSTVDLKLIGVGGTTITDGIAQDTLGQKWRLPSLVNIPLSGEIIITATAMDAGAITAQANTITKILTPTRGWQSVNNLTPAVSGTPYETDTELRIRQTYSTSIPSQSILEGIIGAVASVSGVSRLKGYENDGNSTDSNGIHAHHIALVVEGGSATSIAQAIFNKKTAGTGTAGTTSATITDKYGLQNIIYFYRPTPVSISVEVTITAFSSYLTSYADQIKTEVASYINSLTIGDDVYINKLYAPASLYNKGVANTYNVTDIRIKGNSGNFGKNDIPIAFNAVASSALANITVLVQ